MRMLWIPLATLALLALSTTSLRPQDRKILSPRDSVVLTFDTSAIAVTYSRPSMRGRTIMGGLVPWQKVWRTGANQATHIRTGFDMRLGGAPVPAGTYTLWTLPAPDGWKVILNKQTGQWGTQYDERLDLVRLDASTRTLPSPIDTFTIALERTGKTTGVMRLMWETTIVSVPFTKVNSLPVLSPLDSSSIRFHNRRITVHYSRPSMRGRTIWGVVVPFDTVWRTGANLATTLAFDRNVVVGGTLLPRGIYTLFSLPSRDSLTLIVSTAPAGVPPQYTREQDLLRIAMRAISVRKLIDPFRIWFEPVGRRAVELRLGWADRAYAVRITAP